MDDSLADGLAALSAVLRWRAERRRDDARRRECARIYGTCSWCGEVLREPIHDWHCPSRLAQEDERLLFEGG